MKVWKMILAAGVAFTATVANAAPIVSLIFIDVPAAGLKRYHVLATQAPGETKPNAFSAFTAGGVHQVWAFGGALPTPDTANNAFLGGDVPKDTQLLFGPSERVSAIILTETNTLAGGVGPGAGMGTFSADGISLQPAVVAGLPATYAFFQLVAKDGVQVTVSGQVGAPGYGNTQYSFSLNESQPIPVPAALPLGAAALALLGLRRRLA